MYLVGEKVANKFQDIRFFCYICYLTLTFSLSVDTTTVIDVKLTTENPADAQGGGCAC